MNVCMPLCGFPKRDTWPNSCNLNLYEDGWGSVGFHADDEELFQGWYRDCLIISLSLGQARTFQVRRAWSPDTQSIDNVDDTVANTDAQYQAWSLWLEGWELCTMEGMTQKYYVHSAPKDWWSESMGPRINMTWRWIVAHTPSCPVLCRN